jgi:hypothetical protein
MPRLKVEILVLVDHVDAVLDALHDAGAGNEMKVESVCETSQAAAVTAAVCAVHPYEEPVMHFTALYEPERVPSRKSAI